MLKEIKERILAGGAAANREEALKLVAWPNIDELCDAADEICRTLCGKDLDSCSIVNARSGKCGEDCKWCEQASRHNTGCATYNAIDPEEVMKAARHNEAEGIKRFSLVTAGRAVSPHDLKTFCDIYDRLNKETNLYLCASMGLLTYEELMDLRKSGVKRYHCNLEASADFFPKLCSTHTQEEKKETIRAARKAGMQVCSGGIIGMGETVEQRIDLALELAELDVDSAPLNILNPIKGTPLQDTPLISEEEIIRTAAVWRFIMPKTVIRFAGGRMRLSHESMLRLLKGGVNGALVGDMLTTVSNDIASDRKLFHEADMNF
jgi:biotin synthase